MSAENYLRLELDALIQGDLSTWRFLQQGSLDGVWYWDLEAPENEWMSPEFWRAFGVDPATKRHDPAEWQDLIFKEDLEVALKNFEAHCADPNHPYDQIVRYRHADGSTVWIRCRGLAIRDETGKPIRMLGAHTDLTRIKQSEEEATQARRAAEAANAELRSFAYSISHDLKSPTNTLNLLLEEFRHHMGGRLDDEGRELLEMCDQTVTRMQGLIEYVLDYTRVIGMGQDFEPVDLHACAQRAVGALRADIAGRDAQIQIDPLPSVPAVKQQMDILFQNLISNAIKYCPPDRTPHIKVRQAEDSPANTVQIAVEDNGLGIPKENQEQIFKIFQRLHSRDEIDGVGLGLPMCQHIALNHKGRIDLCSTPGEGSVFTVVMARQHVS